MMDMMSQHYLSLNPVILWEMLIDDFFDMYVDFVIYARRTSEEKDDTKTQYVFIPAKKSIAETGLY